MMAVGPTSTTGLALPFVNGYVVDLGIFFLAFGAFIIVAAGNAVNLTDGLDGLAIVPVMVASATFGLFAYFTGNALFAVLSRHQPRAPDGRTRGRGGRGRSAPASAFSGSMRRRPRSSWATRDRSRSAA